MQAGSDSYFRGNPVGLPMIGGPTVSCRPADEPPVVSDGSLGFSPWQWLRREKSGPF